MRSTTVIMLSVAFLVAGCPTHVVSSDDRRVVVESQSLEPNEAQRLADAECAKSRRVATMISKAGYWDRNYIYECVLSDLPPGRADVVNTANAMPQQPSSRPDAVVTANKASAQPPSSGRAEASDTANKTITQRFRDLQTLKNEGLISEEEYKQKRKVLLDHI